MPHMHATDGSTGAGYGRTCTPTLHALCTCETSTIGSAPTDGRGTHPYPSSSSYASSTWLCSSRLLSVPSHPPYPTRCSSCCSISLLWSSYARWMDDRDGMHTSILPFHLTHTNRTRTGTSVSDACHSIHSDQPHAADTYSLPVALCSSLSLSLPDSSFDRSLSLSLLACLIPLLSSRLSAHVRDRE